MVEVNQSNPKALDSDSFDRYDQVSTCSSLGEYHTLLLDMGRTPTQILNDLENDFLRGYVKHAYFV